MLTSTISWSSSMSARNIPRRRSRTWRRGFGVVSRRGRREDPSEVKMVARNGFITLLEGRRRGAPHGGRSRGDDLVGRRVARAAKAKRCNRRRCRPARTRRGSCGAPGGASGEDEIERRRRPATKLAAAASRQIPKRVGDVRGARGLAPTVSRQTASNVSAGSGMSGIARRAWDSLTRSPENSRQAPQVAR
jgi:hypothetical protein